MSPEDVHVTAEGVDCPVGLRHGDHSLSVGVLEGGVPEEILSNQRPVFMSRDQY